MEILFLVIPVVISVVFVAELLRRRKFAGMSVVSVGVEYPNNYHVLGVGYYHAASRMWFKHPWNEYREDHGYYWDGTWNRVPDQRLVAKSVPDVTEVGRVNAEWRKADPDRVRRFWATVEHGGFGTAIRRSEGS